MSMSIITLGRSVAKGLCESICVSERGRGRQHVKFLLQYDAKNIALQQWSASAHGYTYPLGRHVHLMGNYPMTMICDQIDIRQN